LVDKPNRNYTRKFSLSTS